MKIKLPSINPVKFSREWVLRELAGKVEEILETLGAERLDFLISRGRNLSEFLPPQVEEQYRRDARSWRWAAAIISDDDVLARIPPWAASLVAQHGETGQSWLRAQSRWIRSFFEEDGYAGDRLFWRRRGPAGAITPPPDGGPPGPGPGGPQAEADRVPGLAPGGAEEDE